VRWTYSNINSSGALVTHPLVGASGGQTDTMTSYTRQTKIRESAAINVIQPPSTTASPLVDTWHSCGYAHTAAGQ
jgi:hypothetical protein